MGKKTVDELIDGIVEEGLLVGPDAITEQVMRHVIWSSDDDGSPDIDLDEELPRLIRVYVSVRLSQRRNRPHKLPVPELEQDVVTGRPLSAKVAAIRQAAPTWLEEQVAIGRKNWKKLGDCTGEDLAKLAKKRLRAADDNQAKADMYLAWVERMRYHKVETLRQLPNSILIGDPR